MARTKHDTGAKPTSDAYTGILILSLLALIGGAVFMYLDYSNYEDKPPKTPTYTATPGGGGGAALGGGAGAQGNVGGGAGAAGLAGGGGGAAGLAGGGAMQGGGAGLAGQP